MIIIAELKIQSKKNRERTKYNREEKAVIHLAYGDICPQSQWRAHARNTTRAQKSMMKQTYTQDATNAWHVRRVGSLSINLRSSLPNPFHKNFHSVFWSRTAKERTGLNKQRRENGNKKQERACMAKKLSSACTFQKAMNDSSLCKPETQKTHSTISSRGFSMFFQQFRQSQKESLEHIVTTHVEISRRFRKVLSNRVAYWSDNVALEWYTGYCIHHIYITARGPDMLTSSPSWRCMLILPNDD